MTPNMILKELLQRRNIQVLLSIALYLSFASFFPLVVHQGFYTISLCIKDVLLWTLPITITFFIAEAVSSFEKKALLFIITLLLFEAISNLASIWYAYGCGHLMAHHLPMINKELLHDAFPPLWRIPFMKPSWWSADKGTVVGMLLGLLTLLRMPWLSSFLRKGKRNAEWVLTRIFARLIPLFVLGFIARMYQTRILQEMMTHYMHLMIALCCFLSLYLFGLFYLGNRGHVWETIKNLLPAGAIAFSSGCSLSTIPWTIEGASKNMEDPEMAQAIIPATTNIQQIGDCITNTFLAFIIYDQFYGHIPSFTMWVSFSLVFMLARFATAAILGGAIFIMLPIYESYLHFSGEMIAMILAFNVILDPIITSANVMANGALCRIFEKTWKIIIKIPLRNFPF